jgi:hypothetical protein
MLFNDLTEEGHVIITFWELHHELPRREGDPLGHNFEVDFNKVEEQALFFSFFITE